MDDNLNTFFSRFGGKSRKSEQIINFFPEHNIYIEPFLGSGAIYLKKPSSKLSILNDLDPIIYQIFKNVQKVGNEFDKINNEKYIDFKPCKKKWIECRETLNIGSPFEKLYKALYIIKHSYNGMGFCFSSTRWPENIRDYYKRSLTPYKNKLKKSKIYKQDYKTIVQKYDSPDTFIYFDPPYDCALKSGNYYEKDNMSLEEFRNLLLTLKSKFIVSIDITPYTDELFKDFYKKKMKYNYLSRKYNKSVEEYLISNFKL